MQPKGGIAAFWPLLCFLIVLGGCEKAPKLDRIILSFAEDNSFCEDCPSFRLDFSSAGHVNYNCLRGCTAPGEQYYTVPRERFKELVAAFQADGFFSIPRTDPTRMVIDVPVFRLTYRDERKTYEVVDDYRQNAKLTDMETRFKALTDVESFQKPSVSLYKRLLSHGWNVNTLGMDHRNALSVAVMLRDAESVRFLLQNGLKIIPETFAYAALSNDLQILKLLLKSSNGRLPPEAAVNVLMQAARARNSALLQYVLSLETDPNLGGPETGQTPLMAAVEFGQMENAKLLLAKGANPNAADQFGRRPLWYAASASNTGFITLLMQHKAEIDATDNRGQTALMKAESYCYTWDMEALLKAGADPTIRNNEPTGRPSADPKCQTAERLMREAAAAKSSKH